MEVELQCVYQGDGPLVVPVCLCDLDLHRSRSVSILDAYYDTRGFELRRSGCSLRIRQAESEARPLLTLKGPSRKRSNVKRRYEAEMMLDELPAQDGDMSALLHELGLLRELRRLTGLGRDPELTPIGTLRSHRSEHRYEHGLHRLDLTWDEIEYPTGPPETRLEVEAASPEAERLLEDAASPPERYAETGTPSCRSSARKSRSITSFTAHTMIVAQT